MRPTKHEVTGSGDLFRARLDQIINMKHELVQLADKIDWDFLDGETAPLYSHKGRPGIETRFIIGLLLLKYIYGLSDEGVCDRWVHDPYFQHFTGAEFFQHEFPHERSDLSHWRERLGDKLELLLAESLQVVHDSGAVRTKDLARVTVSWPLSRADQIRSQQQRQHGWMLYSFHAPEVECIGKGKASAPYEFGGKVSVVTTNARAPSGQFVLHTRAPLPGNPYDGHTLRGVSKTRRGSLAARSSAPGLTSDTAATTWKIHDASSSRGGIFGCIKRELRRRSAIEAVIGHIKAEGHLGRCLLKGRAGDAANAILSR